MLVLTRRDGERIRLTMPDGTVVWISVDAASFGRVVLAFDALRSVLIQREEIIRDAPHVTH